MAKLYPKIKTMLILGLLVTLTQLSSAQAQSCGGSPQTCPNPYPNPQIPSVDVFNPYICQGPEMTTEVAARYFAPGASKAIIGQYNLFGRYRVCTKLSGCGSWTLGKIYRYKYNSGTTSEMPNQIQFSLLSTNSAPYFFGYTEFLDVNKNRVSAYTKENHVIDNFSGDYTYLVLESNPVRNPLTGSIRNNCSWFKASNSTSVSSAGEWTESEIILYGTH